MRHFFCDNPYQNFTNNRWHDHDKVGEVDNSIVLVNGKEKYKRSVDYSQNEVDVEAKEKPLKKYGAKAGPLRVRNQESKVGKGSFACVDAKGNVEKMKQNCDYGGDPVCADGKDDDLCIGCGPNSFYICPNQDLGDVCPSGYELERTPLGFCLHYKIKCPTGAHGAHDNKENLGLPIRCPPDSEPVCMSTEIPGKEWPIHPCGCGPHGEPYCSGPERPGTIR